MKKLFIAGIALIAVPATGLAQKEKDQKKDADKNDLQTIVITRESKLDQKTVIEIDGETIKVNGKDVKDLKDVRVNVNTIKGASASIYNSLGQGAWSFDMNDDHMSLFSEDGNRAMLGVVTEGSDKGIEIKSITKESAAEKAGLKKGDVLTRIGTHKIESTDDVTKAIRAHKPGEKVEIAYTRDGKEQKATAELGSWKGINLNKVSVPRVPSMDEWRRAESQTINGGASFYWSGRPKLGLSIQDTDDGKGVKVLEVDEESNAAKAGIKEDDIILSIDDKEVKSTDDLTRTIRENKEKYTFNLKISRGGKTQNIEIKMPRRLKTADL
ncbi:MAG TPA: PDZ domain-containing protein [Flavisolibacter sp.]|nr:PDZ domain-containing protein [Flavisolibacter sp.]